MALGLLSRTRIAQILAGGGSGDADEFSNPGCSIQSHALTPLSATAHAPAYRAPRSEIGRKPASSRRPRASLYVWPRSTLSKGTRSRPLSAAALSSRGNGEARVAPFSSAAWPAQAIVASVHRAFRDRLRGLQTRMNARK